MELYYGRVGDYRKGNEVTIRKSGIFLEALALEIGMTDITDSDCGCAVHAGADGEAMCKCR